MSWTPLTQKPMPQHLARALKRSGEAFDEVWQSDLYEVFVRYMDPDAGRPGALHLSIKRWDREPVTDWRHKQAIKNEVAGPMREGVELFPAESRLVDSANQTHLWVAPEGAELGVGFSEYAAFDKAMAVKTATAQGYDPAILTKSKQRDWEPGISTGPDYARRHGWLRG